MLVADFLGDPQVTIETELQKFAATFDGCELMLSDRALMLLSKIVAPVAASEHPARDYSGVRVRFEAAPSDRPGQSTGGIVVEPPRWVVFETTDRHRMVRLGLLLHLPYRDGVWYTTAARIAASYAGVIDLGGAVPTSTQRAGLILERRPNQGWDDWTSAFNEPGTERSTMPRYGTWSVDFLKHAWAAAAMLGASAILQWPDGGGAFAALPLRIDVVGKAHWMNYFIMPMKPDPVAVQERPWLSDLAPREGGLAQAALEPPRVPPPPGED